VPEATRVPLYCVPNGGTIRREIRIRVTCRLFGRYAEALERETCVVELNGPATVADAIRELRRTVKHGDLLPESPLVAVNRVHATASRALDDGDELAVLPPLAGG
jgi:molybdopterin synthase catalytic subunit/molybdopterin synthase sulfur carrier subunit